ncbi:MAG: MOSC domain-containing protein [Opitutaceae bacterium]
MHVASLYLYPVKSLRGISVSMLEADRFGIAGDRRFMVVDDSTSKVLTQRTAPGMAVIATAFDQGLLQLTAPGGTTVSIPTQPADGPERSVTVWKDTVTAVDCGNVVAQFLSDSLGQACRLVQVGAHFSRAVRFKAGYIPAPSPMTLEVGFADAYPALIVSEASLSSLNDRLLEKGEDPVPMDRFRPNIVIAGSEAFSEDTWQRFQIGGLTFWNSGPCARCTVPTTDQATGKRGKEPLATLAQFRRDAHDQSQVNFGQNAAIVSHSGPCRLGDVVQLLT